MATNNAINVNSGLAGQVLTSNGEGVAPTFQPASGGGGVIVTQFDAVSGGAGNTLVSFGPGTAGQVYQSAGAGSNPAYSTATYPLTTTANQILYSSATNTIGGLSTANNGALITSASGVPSILAANTPSGTFLEYNGASIQFSNYLQEFKLIDQFSLVQAAGGGTYVSQMIWAGVVASGNINISAGAINSGHPACIQLNTGASTTGSALLLSAANTGTSQGMLILGGGSIDIYWVVNLSALSTAGQRYIVQLGLGDGTSSSVANGVYFEYSDNVNSGNWEAITVSASTPTTVSGAIAATTAFQTLRINVNAAASTITFYVNGTSIGTSSTNIPTTTISPYAAIYKTAGTNQINMNINLFSLYQNLTNPR